MSEEDILCFVLVIILAWVSGFACGYIIGDE